MRAVGGALRTRRGNAQDEPEEFMSVYRVSMQFPFDTALPKDQITITPHFFGTDPQALAAALDANLAAYTPVTGKPYTIKVYDAQKAPPSYPLATISHTGTSPTTGFPREIAICLSYYTTYNRPRFRGRLYLPAQWFTSVVQLRPTGAIMTAVLGFGTNVLAKSLPQGHNWVVYSPTEKTSKGGVSDMWVDDEWDTVRSRGLVPTTRQTGKIS
jgi:hypothetical protein